MKQPADETEPNEVATNTEHQLEKACLQKIHNLPQEENLLYSVQGNET